jgi:hypothetical protein
MKKKKNDGSDIYIYRAPPTNFASISLYASQINPFITPHPANIRFLPLSRARIGLTVAGAVTGIFLFVGGGHVISK